MEATKPKAAPTTKTFETMKARPLTLMGRYASEKNAITAANPDATHEFVELISFDFWEYFACSIAAATHVIAAIIYTILLGENPLPAPLMTVINKKTGKISTPTNNEIPA
jgi:hypothetical protein